MKTCSKCNTKKELTEFYDEKNKRDGKTKECAECIKDRIKKYRQKNKELIKQQRKKHWEKNRENCLARQKAYYEANKTRINKKKRQYEKEQLKLNPELRLVKNMRGYMRLILKGSRKAASQMELLGCTREHYLQHMEAQFTEGMTWDNYGEWHQDHIQPVSSFDQTDPEQQKICWHYTNFQPMWAAENIQKRDSIVEHQVNLL